MSDWAATSSPLASATPLVRRRALRVSAAVTRRRRILGAIGRSILFLITATSALAVLFIFYFIARDAIPYFQQRGFAEFFTGRAWYPASDPPSFGAWPIFYGSIMVTLAAALIAVPVGVLGAVCLSDILPFKLRQIIKPVVEVLAAIPSVAFGFFALVVLAPLLQSHGGVVLAGAWWVLATPLAALFVYAASDVLAERWRPGRSRSIRAVCVLALAVPLILLLAMVGQSLAAIRVASGANALNVALVLAIMALPTIMSVSEDALQAVGRDLREGAYALGATRAEMLVRVILPAASSGLAAAVILGMMRVIGETMVVWMASGNAASIPTPWWNVLEPIRTLTATIAGDMGEADHITGSARYHVLWAMALSLLTISFILNALSERLVARAGRRRA